MRQPRLYPLAVFLVVLTLGLSAAIAFDLTPWLRGPISSGFEWQWRHVFPPDVVGWKLIWPVSVAVVVGLWAYRVRSSSQISNWVLLALAALALAFRLSVQEISRDSISIVARVLNPGYFGYFPPAVTIDDMSQFLRDYAELQPTLPYYRLTTHPPGNVVFYWLIIKSVKAFPALAHLAEPVLMPRIAAWPEALQNYAVPDVLAAMIASLLVPGLSVLSILPLYHLAKQLFGVQAARAAVLLFVFVPALTLFVPVSDDLYTLLAVLTFWLAASSLALKSYWRLWLAGLAAGSGLFQSLSVIPLVVAAMLFVILHYAAQGRAYWRNGLIALVVFGLGLAMLWVMIWLAFGLNPIKVFANCLATYEARMRSYWWSVVYNPYDVLLFAGIPVAMHFILALAALGRRLIARQPLILSDSLLLALVIAMLVLNVGGSLRGETARTLLYVMPLLALFAAADITRDPKRPLYYLALTLVLMGIQTVVFQATLAVYH